MGKTGSRIPGSDIQKHDHNTKITENKKQFLDLLLVADEQEDMIDRYLPDGDLFALHDGDLKSVCVVLPIDNEVCELKNIATYEQYRGMGYGRALIQYICDQYREYQQCWWNRRNTIKPVIYKAAVQAIPSDKKLFYR